MGIGVVYGEWLCRVCCRDLDRDGGERQERVRREMERERERGKKI